MGCFATLSLNVFSVKCSVDAFNFFSKFVMFCVNFVMLTMIFVYMRLFVMFSFHSWLYSMHWCMCLG